MNRPPRLLAAIVMIALALFACDGDSEAELTTTSSLVVPTTSPDVESTTSTPSDESTTTTTLAGEPVESYDVVLRESTDDGEVLYIVVPPGDYTSVDLENFVGDLIDDDDDIESAEVFDDRDALDAFLLASSQQTADDLALIDQHHLVSLIDGNRIRFQGPYADFGEYSIGS